MLCVTDYQKNIDQAKDMTKSLPVYYSMDDEDEEKKTAQQPEEPEEEEDLPSSEVVKKGARKRLRRDAAEMHATFALEAAEERDRCETER